jgi:hypothetical protein
MKLLIVVCSIIFSYLGWYLAEPLGFLWAFSISGAASLVGVYVGWRLAQQWGV